MNQSRYFARAARSSAPVDPFSCLQHAMWTLAASMGTQFQHIQPTLYSQTRSALECWEPDMINESIPIEHVQAWILLAMYELTQGNPQRGWISAGRCFRLVYFMKLHEVDNPRAWVDAATANLSWVEVEERRRAFWAAYSLDRYANLINQLPLTLNEQVVSLRGRHALGYCEFLTALSRYSLVFQHRKSLFNDNSQSKLSFFRRLQPKEVLKSSPPSQNPSYC